MATIEETIWVNDPAAQHSTVQTLIGQGGTVVNDAPDAITVRVEKKLNVVLLVVLLVLGCIPGLVYLLWHFAANADQVVHVRVGQPSNIGGYKPDPASDPMNPANAPTAPGAAADPSALPAGGADPYAIPSTPTADPYAVPAQPTEDPYAIPGDVSAAPYVPGLPYPETRGGPTDWIPPTDPPSVPPPPPVPPAPPSTF